MAAGFILLTGLAAAYFHLIGANDRSAPASQIVLPKALAEPNSYKPLTVEQALKANDALPFAQRVDGPARRFVLRTNSDTRARAIECRRSSATFALGPRCT